MTDIPEPLVPDDVDLRDFPYTPLFRSRLFGSSFHARATDAEWRAGVTLWLKSWDQVPAGTLPDDDTDLCRLAELGRDLKEWAKIKTGAMRGWFTCSDGRMHHKTVAEGVLEAWSKRTKATSKGKAGAAARWGTGNANANANAEPEDNQGNAPANAHANGTGNAPANAPAIARAMPSDGKGREGKGREVSKQPRARPGGRHPANGAGPPRWDDPAIKPGSECGESEPKNLDRPIVNGWFLDTCWFRVLDASGMSSERCALTDPRLVGWLKAGYVPDQIIETIRKISNRASYDAPASLAYFDQAIREQNPQDGAVR